MARGGHGFGSNQGRCASLALAATLAAAAIPAGPAGSAEGEATRDGRAPLASLQARFAALGREHGFVADTLHVYPGREAPAISAWRSAERGEALWILAGIHGEEPAGPNAIAAEIAGLAALTGAGVPLVLIPLANPVGYLNDWRYPNTAERDWRKGGYSVGDAEHLLPDLDEGAGPRAPAPPGPDARALTEYVLRTARDYPPLLVIDLHEDELSTEGGYLYSQGAADGAAVAAAVLEALEGAGMPLRRGGRTRFGEPIVDGVIRLDDRGQPLRDGSIDELLAAPQVFVEGRLVPGPAAPVVIVVETPAFAGARLESRIAAQRAVLQRLPRLWTLARDARAGPAPAAPGGRAAGAGA